jgi:hypothetical protein
MQFFRMMRSYFSIVLILSQFFSSTYSFACTLVCQDLATHARHPAFGDVAILPIKHANKSHELLLSDSLVCLKHPLILWDAATQKAIGIISKTSSIDGDVFYIEMVKSVTIKSFGIHAPVVISSTEEIVLDAAPSDHLVLKAPIVSFASDITSCYQMAIQSETFLNHHTLIFKNLYLETNDGKNTGRIFTRDGIDVKGSFDNQSLMGSFGMVRINGAKFLNNSVAARLYCGDLLTTVDVYGDSGNLVVFKDAKFSVNELYLGEKFGFLGHSFLANVSDLYHDDMIYGPSDDMVDVICGALSIQQSVVIQANRFEEGKGAIIQRDYHDPRSIIVSALAQCLKVFPDAENNLDQMALDTPYKTDMTCVSLLSQQSFASGFWIDMSQGSVYLKSPNDINVNAPISHGEDVKDQTHIASETLVSISEGTRGQLGDRAVINAPFKIIQGIPEIFGNHLTLTGGKTLLGVFGSVTEDGETLPSMPVSIYTKKFILDDLETGEVVARFFNTETLMMRSANGKLTVDMGLSDVGACLMESKERLDLCFFEDNTVQNFKAKSQTDVIMTGVSEIGSQKPLLVVSNFFEVAAPFKNILSLDLKIASLESRGQELLLAFSPIFGETLRFNETGD